MNNLQQTIVSDVQRALSEALGSGDITASLLPEDLPITADIIAREPLLMCGQAWVEEVFRQLHSQIKINWLVAEGQWLAQPTTLATVEGPARYVLTGERTALNFLQTLSGTATRTHHYVQKFKGSKTQLLDTRKTIPGLRIAQKYAVTCGGGVNHRLGLYDAFLIKENHIKACGSITQAISMARATYPDRPVEVEVETLNELQEAIAVKPERIMLDNFDEAMVKKALIMNQNSSAKLEISGGLTLDKVDQMVALGVDYISVGDLTKSVQAIDLSLLVRDRV